MSISPAEITENARYATQQRERDPDRTVVELRDESGTTRVIYFRNVSDPKERRRKWSCPVEIFASWADYEVEPD